MSYNLAIAMPTSNAKDRQCDFMEVPTGEGSTGVDMHPVDHILPARGDVGRGDAANNEVKINQEQNQVLSQRRVSEIARQPQVVLSIKKTCPGSSSVRNSKVSASRHDHSKSASQRQREAIFGTSSDELSDLSEDDAFPQPSPNAAKTPRTKSDSRKDLNAVSQDIVTTIRLTEKGELNRCDTNSSPIRKLRNPKKKVYIIDSDSEDEIVSVPAPSKAKEILPDGANLSIIRAPAISSAHLVLDSPSATRLNHKLPKRGSSKSKLISPDIAVDTLWNKERSVSTVKLSHGDNHYENAKTSSPSVGIDKLRNKESLFRPTNSAVHDSAPPNSPKFSKIDLVTNPSPTVLHSPASNPGNFRSKV